MEDHPHGPQSLYNNYTEQVKVAVEKFNESSGKPYLKWPVNFQGAATDFERVTCLLKVLTGTHVLGKAPSLDCSLLYQRHFYFYSV